jgi:chromosome segregation protein
VRVAETRRDNVAAQFAQLGARQTRLAADLAAVAVPTDDPMREVEEQLAQEHADLAGKQEALAALQKAVETLQADHRHTADAWERESKRLAELEAREQALAALQAKIGHGTDVDGWLDAHGLARARRLWQMVDIEDGWEDALEAVLRERLSALELGRLDDVAQWVADGASLPRRIAAYTPAPEPVRHPPHDSNDALLAKVRLKVPEVGRLLADGLFGIRCRPDLGAALTDRDRRRPRRRCSAMSSSPARTPRPAITSPSPSMMPCKGLPW